MLDIYTEITNRIIQALEQGTVPWHKPWTGGTMGCISYSTGKPYSLLNHILLGGESGEYITFRQCALAGGHVRKGEKSRMIVFWKPFETENEETGEIERHFILKHFNVFHLAQCEGISPRWTAAENRSDLIPDEAAEAIIRNYTDQSGVRFSAVHSGRAFYRPSTDEVVVPELSQYARQEEYYGTVFHELVHSTGHPGRLNRISDTAAFGSHEYSREELCAELGAAFLINRCGLETQASFDNSAAYIAGWLSALKNDRRLVVSAASAAEKAVKLITEKEEGAEDVRVEE